MLPKKAFIIELFFKNLDPMISHSGKKRTYGIFNKQFSADSLLVGQFIWDYLLYLEIVPLTF